MREDPFYKAFVATVLASPKRRAPLKPLLTKAESASPAAAELLKAFAHHKPVLDFGWRAMDGELADFAETFNSGGIEKDFDDYFPPESGLRIGGSTKGEVYFGFHWGREELEFVEIDHEYGEIACFDTATEFFQHVRETEEERDEDDIADDLLNLFDKATGMPSAPPPPRAKARASGFILELMRGKTPPHPFSHGYETYGRSGRIRVSDPSKGGRRLLVRRPAPEGPAGLCVRDGEGKTTDIKWAAKADIYGLCSVPNHERVLLSTGVPGPLVEINLETLAKRELLAKVKWSPGFLDDEHLAVFDGTSLLVYRYSDGDLGEPLHSVEFPGNNLFVAPGLAFIKAKPPKPNAFFVFRWDGKDLDSPIECKTTGGNPNFFSASVTENGSTLLAAVDLKAAVTWYRCAPI